MDPNIPNTDVALLQLSRIMSRISHLRVNNRGPAIHQPGVTNIIDSSRLFIIVPLKHVQRLLNSAIVLVIWKIFATENNNYGPADKKLAG